MKWFKHESDARNSLKLRKVRRKYGADGYAIYWFCIEAIAYEIDKDNLTFDLKEDAETIGFELNIQEKRVEEIMTYMVEIGLFESSQGIITCLKLAERIDKSMTNSPKLRRWLDSKNVMTPSGDVMTLDDNANTCAELDIDKELDKDKRPKDLLVEQKNRSTRKLNFTDGQLRCAKAMYQKILEVLPKEPKPNFEKWANEIRLATKALKITTNDFYAVFIWANADEFWRTNIRSPMKLRKQYPVLETKSHEEHKTTFSAAKNKTPETALERFDRAHGINTAEFDGQNTNY